MMLKVEEEERGAAGKGNTDSVVEALEDGIGDRGGTNGRGERSDKEGEDLGGRNKAEGDEVLEGGLLDGEHLEGIKRLSHKVIEAREGTLDLKDSGISWPIR